MENSKESVKSITEHMDFFMDLFKNITKEECDTIEEVLNWEDEKKMAFFLAKGIFEERNTKRRKK